ncbi:MAG: glycosyltransferase family 2 protein [Candidatus Marinimicrobia bacterium]|nr:glycosyltransferase family 2 protein [Candidatus Neomarinimicrobiota bacterium]MCF7828554.1 glycosyltransferase family 2 protein [Candidatus Neomarinimicrobiota bacterium]MCF7880295.1 glycosyltransferase family 2 protein [Candidatus Neomarinimicrobiota bacterium]
MASDEQLDSPESLPSISLIIACYNEEGIIERKIENTLALEYPKDLLEVLVISDGSTDNTVSIARKMEESHIRVYDRVRREGKTAVQNVGAEIATGEILVFSDANALYVPDALKQAVKKFKDPKVAGICGEVKFVSTAQAESVSQEEEFYWGYEQFLKRVESKVSSVIGANGAIYAIRKNLYDPLRNDIISDLVEPLLLVKKGFQVKYEQKAVAIEEISIGYRKEFQRKSRIILRSLHGVAFVSNLLNPFKYGIFSIQLWSHKLLRWLVPLVLGVMFLSNLLLISSGTFMALFLVQILFYALAGIGWAVQKNSFATDIWFFRLPFYFCLVNLAALSALIQYVRGKNIVTWEPQR